jgi:membrane-associated phospholipid phosphatase
MDDVLATWLNEVVRRDGRVQSLVALSARRLASIEVALMLLLAVSGRRGSAARMLMAVSLVYVASETVGIAWPRQRPFSRLPAVQPLVAHASGRSFPSRHVASGLAMAAIGGREHRRLGLLMATVAWALGGSRIAAGLHYPSDVLAGAALGAAVGRYTRGG